LSFARNYAAGVALGKWLAYLDDDATYSNDFLEKSLNLLSQHQLDGISGIVLDYKTHKPIARSLQFNTSQFLDINSFNLWMSSASIVSKKMAIEINGFDSNFGSEKRWGSNEESDFCLRLLHQKAKLYFDSNLCVYHPSETEKLNNLNLKRIWRRGFSYGAGRGALIRKHSSRMPVWGCVQLIKMLLTAGLAVIQSILMIQLRYILRDIASFCGRCYGFLMYRC
jgi:GT2 family glycosyltransferase